MYAESYAPLEYQQPGQPRRTNSMPVDKKPRSTTNASMVVNAKPKTVSCDYGSMEVDSDYDYCEPNEPSIKEQRNPTENEESVTLKELSDSRQKDMSFDITKRELGYDVHEELDFLETPLNPQNDPREPRDHIVPSGHPLPDLPSQRLNPALDPMAVAGATAAVSNASAIPEDITESFNKIHAYYRLHGTTLEAEYHKRLKGQLQQEQANQFQQQQQQQQQHQPQHQQQRSMQQHQQNHRASNSSSPGWMSYVTGGLAGSDDHQQLKAAKKQLEAIQREKIVILSDLNKAQRDYNRYRSKYYNLKEDHEALLRERNEQGESIKQAQDAVFDIMKKTATHAETDDKIRSAIQSDLLAPIDEWTKDFALKKELTAAEYSNPEFQQFFSRIACNGATPEYLASDPTIRQRQVPKYLAKAFLSSFVMSKVFDSPFFLLNHLNSEETSEAVNIEQLDILRHYFVEANPKEGNKWRAQTVAAISELVDVYDKRKNYPLLAICEGFANEFETSGARFILQEKTGESHKELVEVFRKAGELALRLWRYPTNMGPVGVDLLAERSFMLRSSDMEAHISHRLEDASMDGSKVALVIFPGIRVNGNQEGERYGETKMWLKAQVRLTKAPASRGKDEKSEDTKPGKSLPPPPPPPPPATLRRSEKAQKSRYV